MKTWQVFNPSAHNGTSTTETLSLCHEKGLFRATGHHLTVNHSVCVQGIAETGNSGSSTPAPKPLQLRIQRIAADKTLPQTTCALLIRVEFRIKTRELALGTKHKVVTIPKENCYFHFHAPMRKYAVFCHLLCCYQPFIMTSPS